MSFRLPITIERPTGFEWMVWGGTCPRCRTRSLVLEFDGNGYEWRQCSRCSVVFVVPKVPPYDIDPPYEDN